MSILEKTANMLRNRIYTKERVIKLKTRNIAGTKSDSTSRKFIIIKPHQIHIFLIIIFDRRLLKIKLLDIIIELLQVSPPAYQRKRLANRYLEL